MRSREAEAIRIERRRGEISQIQRIDVRLEMTEGAIGFDQFVQLRCSQGGCERRTGLTADYFGLRGGMYSDLPVCALP